MDQTFSFPLQQHEEPHLRHTKRKYIIGFGSFVPKNITALVLTWVTSTISLSVYIPLSLSLLFISSFPSPFSLSVSLRLLLHFLSSPLYVLSSFLVPTYIFLLLSVGNPKITDNNNNIAQQF